MQLYAFCSFTTVGVQRVPVSGTLVCCVVNERPPQSGGASEPYKLGIVFFFERKITVLSFEQTIIRICCGVLVAVPVFGTH